MGVFLHIHIIVVIRTFVPVLRGLFSGLNITNREDCCSRTHGSFSAYTYYYNNADFIIPVYRGLFYDYMFEPYSTLCPRIKWVIRAKMHSICKNFIILVYRGLFLKKAHYYMIVMVILVQTGVILSIYRVRPWFYSALVDATNRDIVNNTLFILLTFWHMIQVLFLS